MSILSLIKTSQNLLKTSGISALSQALQGDLEGAAQGLLQAPRDTINRIGASGGVVPGHYARGMQARQDAIQNWCWYCLLPDIENPNAETLSFKSSSSSGGGSGSGSANSSGIFEYGKVLVSGANHLISNKVSLPWYYVQAANVPFREVKVDSTMRNGHQTHYPDGYDVGQLSLDFFMDSTSKSHEYLKAWQSLVLSSRNPKFPKNQGEWGMPASYKRDIVISILSVTKREVINLKYINCWPVTLSPLDLTSGNAEALVQKVSFAVEDVDVFVSADTSIKEQLVRTATGYATSALTGAAGSILKGLGI